MWNASHPLLLTAQLRRRAGLFTLCVLSAMRAIADDWEDHEQIRRAAENAVRQERSGVSGEQIKVTAGELDQRLRLPRCPAPLRAVVPEAARATRVSVEVRCDAATRWKVYVPVQVTAKRPIVVTARALSRGNVLTDDDVILADRDAIAPGYAWITAVDLAVGRTLRRSVGAGTPITANLLDAPVIVRRGQQVTLEVRSGALAVRSAGVAEADGALGEVIPVTNLRSGKKVQGIVRSEKSVQILLQ